MMATYPIPLALAGQYRGAGPALAAVAGGQVVALRYLSEIAPPEVADALAEGEQHIPFLACRWLGTAEAGSLCFIDTWAFKHGKDASYGLTLVEPATGKAWTTAPGAPALDWEGAA